MVTGIKKKRQKFIVTVYRNILLFISNPQPKQIQVIKTVRMTLGKSVSHVRPHHGANRTEGLPNPLLNEQARFKIKALYSLQRRCLLMRLLINRSLENKLTLHIINQQTTFYYRFQIPCFRKQNWQFVQAGDNGWTRFWHLLVLLDSNMNKYERYWCPCGRIRAALLRFICNVDGMLDGPHRFCMRTLGSTWNS